MTCPLFSRIFSYIEELEESPDSSSDPTPGRCSFLAAQFAAKPKPLLTFSHADLGCLDDSGWINDEVLNSYLSLLSTQSNTSVGYTNTHFFPKLRRDGCKAASCWRGIRELLSSCYSVFLIPVCLGLHWILAVVDLPNGNLSILDSFNNAHLDVAEALNEFLASADLGPLPVVHPYVPEQQNSYDCGVFVMMFARCFFLGMDIQSVNQRMMPNARRMIYQELCDAKNVG
jgi:sentrin-specific protease 1